MDIKDSDKDLDGYGMYRIAEDKYFTNHAISNSDINVFRQSPNKYKLYKAGKMPRRESSSFNFGSAFHVYVLEPDLFEQQYAIEPKFDKRTKKGKEGYAKWSQGVLGKKIISESEYEDIKQMRISLCNYNPPDRSLTIFDDYFSRGDTEVSMFWRDRNTGLECRGRVDYIKTRHIIDLKSTADASYESFKESILKWGYHRQAAFYLDGASAITGENFNQFTFICVEKKFPFEVAVYSLDTAFIERGREEYKASLAKIKQCQESDVWHGLQTSPQMMCLK